MPAGSKKYRWLSNFVTREAKKERGQDLDEEPEQPDADSSVMSFRSVQGLHNCDTASGFFRNEDLPPTQHSQIISFPDTDQKTRDITQSINDLSLSHLMEDKKESQSLGQPNPFLRMPT